MRSFFFLPPFSKNFPDYFTKDFFICLNAEKNDGLLGNETSENYNTNEPWWLLLWRKDQSTQNALHTRTKSRLVTFCIYHKIKDCFLTKLTF